MHPHPHHHHPELPGIQEMDNPLITVSSFFDGSDSPPLAPSTPIKHTTTTTHHHHNPFGSPSYYPFLNHANDVGACNLLTPSPLSTFPSQRSCISSQSSHPNYNYNEQQHVTITDIQLKLVRNSNSINDNDYRWIASVASQSAIPDSTIHNIQRNCIQHRVHNTHKSVFFSMSLERGDSLFRQISDFVPTSTGRDRRRRRLQVVPGLNFRYVPPQPINNNSSYRAHAAPAEAAEEAAASWSDIDDDGDGDSDIEILHALHPPKRKRKLSVAVGVAQKTWTKNKKRKQQHVQTGINSRNLNSKHADHITLTTKNTNSNRTEAVNTDTTTTTTNVLDSARRPIPLSEIDYHPEYNENTSENEMCMSYCSQSQRPQLLAGKVHRDNHGVNGDRGQNCGVKPEVEAMDVIEHIDGDGDLDFAENDHDEEQLELSGDESAEKKRLFQIAVQKKCHFLHGNTKWAAGDHGPRGLHKTPTFWCRYCGSRVSDKWWMKGKICSKHHRCIYYHQRRIWRQIFDAHHNDLLPDRPLDASQNSELHFLRLFAAAGLAAEQTQNTVNTSRIKPEQLAFSGNEEEEEFECDVDVHQFWDVFKIHSTMNLVHTETAAQLNFYLIEWSGFDIGECSWEPEDNLNCDAKLVEFDDRIEAHEKYPECVECNKYGQHWKVYKRPCFTHHFDHEDYKDVFEKYPRTNIRRLAGVALPRNVIDEYYQRVNAINQHDQQHH